MGEDAQTQVVDYNSDSLKSKLSNWLKNMNGRITSFKGAT